VEKGASFAKPIASQIAELLTSLSGFAWPIVILIGLYLLRGRLREIISVAIRRFEQAADIEIGSLKLKGATVTQSGEVLKSDNESFEIVRATARDVQTRQDFYEKQRNLMLVHTVKPVEPAEFIEGYRVFSASIFIHPHRNFGRLNDVKQVTYFLGDKWGGGKYGEKYAVTSANDQFAMTAQMYGSFLCVAEIEFHDGTKIETQRYIDVEMAPVFGVTLAKARG